MVYTHGNELKFCYMSFVVLLGKCNSEECCSNLLLCYASTVALNEGGNRLNCAKLLCAFLPPYNQHWGVDLKKKKRFKCICGTYLWHPRRNEFSEKHKHRPGTLNDLYCAPWLTHSSNHLISLISLHPMCKLWIMISSFVHFLTSAQHLPISERHLTRFAYQ